MAKKRPPIPKKIENEVMFKSRGLCYCGKRGDDGIHHIDKNPANNTFDNLVLVCEEHHDAAHVMYGLKKRLSPKQIKMRRDALYKKNDEKDRLELKHYSSTLRKITDETLFRSSLDASIVLEIIKIKSKFFEETDWKKRYDILWELKKYSDYSNIKISHQVFKFFAQLSSHTRGGMTASVSDAIMELTLDYFPYPKTAKEKKLASELAVICGHIAFGIAYDAFIHLGNLAVAGSGLEILKFLYMRGKELKIPAITEIALSQHSKIENSLQRPERGNELDNAKRFLKEYKKELDAPGIHIPDNMPQDLFNLIQEHQKKSRQN